MNNKHPICSPEQVKNPTQSAEWLSPFTTLRCHFPLHSTLLSLLLSHQLKHIHVLTKNANNKTKKLFSYSDH